VVLEQIVILLVDLGPDRVFIPLLVVGLEILAPSWAISSASTHLIYALTWEISMILDWT